MSELIKHSKKVLSAALTVTTIVWSVGLFALAPVTVSAAAGDLVKTAGDPAVYLVDADGVTIHPFPHANVYSSWGFPADFSSVISTDLSGFTVGNDVEFRDGALVRALETPAVYIKSAGKLRPVVSAEVFETLGYSYDNITWLPQSFLDKYTSGSTVTSTTTHPDGTLVKYASSSTVYLVQDGKKREFASSDVRKVNGYANIPVITIPSSETYSDGSKIVVKESSLTVPVGVGSAPSTSNPSQPVGSGLSVSVASDTPQTTTIISTSSANGQALIPLLKLNFTAGSDGAVMVKTLKVERFGVSADEDFDNLYLYEGDSVTKQLSDGVAISSGGIATFNKSTGLFTVAAGTTKSVMVRGDLAYNATAGKTVGFRVASASAVTTDGATVSGSFPANGNLMSTATVGDLGKLTFSNNSTPSAADTSINPDQSDQEIWKTTFTSANQALDIRGLRYSVIGSVQRTDIQNFALYSAGTLVTTVAELNDDFEIVYDLSSNPIEITKGSSKVISVRADIVSGSSRDFYLSFQNQVDVLAFDKNYSVYIEPYTSGSWSIVKPTGTYLIASGSLSISKATDSPNEDLTLDDTNVKLAKYEFRASGEDVKVKNLLVGATTTGMAGLDNVRVLVDGVQVGSTRDIAASSSTTTFTFGSTFIVPAAATSIVEIYGDVKKADGTSYSDGNSIQIELAPGSSNAQRVTSLGSFNAPTSTTQANSLTISTGSLTISKFSGYGDQTLVAGTNNARIGSFVLSSGSAEGATVSSITVALGTYEYGSLTNLWLKDNASGNQLGTTKVTPSASNIFSVNFTIPQSGTKVIDVYANIDSDATDGTITADIDASGTGVSTGNTVDATNVVVQTITVGSGNLYLNNGSHAASANIVAGSTGTEVAEFSFSAENEGFTISKLIVKTENNFASTVSAVKLQYTNEAGTTKTASQVFVPSSTQVYASATFTGLDIYVGKDATSNVKVMLDTVLLSSSGASGANGAVYLDWNEGFKATGKSGTDKTTVGSADVNGNSFYIRKSVPTFTRVNVTGAPTSSSALYKFNVVADAAGNIEIKQMGFLFTTSGVNITAVRLWDTAASIYLTDTGASPNSSGQVYTNVGSANSSDNDVIVVGTSAKTYEVRGTVSGWGDSSDSITISPIQDSTAASTASSASLIGTTYGLVWSDKSVSNHSTTSADWTNGYLIKNLDEAQSF